MRILLLALIYIAFISLGLPDGLLGAAWPSMYQTLSVPLSFAGYVTMVIAGGTIISSLSCDRISRKLSTQWILVISVALTAIGIFGFSFSTAYWQLCLWAIPYGLGAGAVDSSLNNYVSLHYKSRQMSWLHSFWGVGATVGPYIVSLCLGHSLGWEWGYRIVGFIQSGLVVILLLSEPLWGLNAEVAHSDENLSEREHLGFFKTWGLPGAAFVFLSFFAYCALESTAGLWAASYFVIYHGLSPEKAASWASLFYLGIAGGRFLDGFIANHFGDRKMVRMGLILLGIGLIVLSLPWGEYTPLVGLLIVGLGCAPVYPSLIHETPINFGREHSQEVIGIQMATAYVGSTFMPPLFGLLVKVIPMECYPYYLMAFFAILVTMSEGLNHATKERWLEQKQAH